MVFFKEFSHSKSDDLAASKGCRRIQNLSNAREPELPITSHALPEVNEQRPWNNICACTA